MARAQARPHTEITSVGVIDLLRRGCWASVPADTIASLIDGGRVVEFPAGQTVYAEADAERLAVVLQGLLRVYMHASDGRQVTVRYVRRGDLLGGPALIGGPAPVFVQAVAPGAAFFFDLERVKRTARGDASVAWALAEESVHRLYDVLEELAGNTFATVRQRVARHLLDLAASRPASGRLTALVSQQDLANSVGSVREVVARVLAELRNERLVRTSPGRVEILDPVRMSRQLWFRAHAGRPEDRGPATPCEA
jgi:CRP/FNR family transcriptional regulator, cyclic AMP receptor protein